MTLDGERQAVGAISSMPASPTLPFPSLFRLTLAHPAGPLRGEVCVGISAARTMY
jgi:hypothetical protein